VKINNCIDSIYQIHDTLLLILTDNRTRGVKTRGGKTEDSSQMYMWEAILFPINKHTIKRYHIELLIPSHYINYTLIGIKTPFLNEVCFFKKKKERTYKYVGKKDIIKNNWVKKENRDAPKWYFKDLLWESVE
jgi:hypothetical protein